VVEEGLVGGGGGVVELVDDDDVEVVGREVGEAGGVEALDGGEDVVEAGGPAAADP
jgi:galactokinase